MNLPESISIEQLRQFKFGDADAAQDELIMKEECICATPAAETFLRNNSSILVGERGTGKTGLIRLLMAGRLRLVAKGESKQHYIKIDQKLNYKILNDGVIPNVISRFKDASLSHMLLWEIWIASLLIEKVEEIGDIPKELASEIKFFRDFFEIANAKKGVIELFLNQKKQVGVKVDPSQLGNVFTWDFYTSLAPDKNAPEEKKKTGQILKIGKLKGLLNAFFEDRSERVYILIDRLDEFVVKEEYETQMNTILGLLHTERSYRDFTQIELKVSVRSDIFERLDLRELGADKVYSRTVSLEWLPDKIKHLMATRILYNYFTSLDLKSISVSVNRENCYIDKNSNDLSSLLESQEGFLNSIKHLFLKLASRFKHKQPFFDSGRGRRVNLTEEIHDVILRSFFGDHVLHFDENGKECEMDFSEYIQSHFKTGLEITTPRLMIWFLELCVVEAVDYYKNNPDINSEKIAFPLIPKECVMTAYVAIKDKLWSYLGQESGKFREQVYAFRESIQDKEFSFNEVRKKMKVDTESEMRDLLAVLQHLGIIYCLDKSKKLTDRRYRYPLLFWPVNLPTRRWRNA